jgi:hypothetical protein
MSNEDLFTIQPGFNDWASFTVESSDEESDNGGEFSDLEDDSDDDDREVRMLEVEAPDIADEDDDDDIVPHVSFHLVNKIKQ